MNEIEIRKSERERIIEILHSNLDCEFTAYDYLGFRDHSPYCVACAIEDEINAG